MSLSPHKPNIVYWVRQKTDIEETFCPMVELLRIQRTSLPRMVIFCQRYDDCATIYELFNNSLGAEFTEPVGMPNIAKFRLMDMYTSPTQTAVKNNIVKSFCEEGGCLRIVACTIAFGMGIDCPDVTQIVHWGPSSDVESYV